MIDSHCHFDLSVFDNKRETVLKACQIVGVTRILVPGLSLEQFSRLKFMKDECADITTQQAVQEGWPKIDIAFGLHPYYLAELNDTEQHIQHRELVNVATAHQQSIVAVGECGLDATLAVNMAYQEKILEQHIVLATDLKKPLVLHHRKSHNELIRLLKQHRFRYGGVIHAFSGSEHTANTYIDMGFKLGVGGTITYPRALKTRHTIQQVPIEHLLLETDAPDMPLQGFQGQVNSPARLPLIAQALSVLKKCDVATLISASNASYENVFHSK